jgi:hypothetical protein
MNRDDDFIRRLEDYLDTFDGVTPLPITTREAVHARLPQTQQVHPVTKPGRMLGLISRTSTRARWGMAAAVLAVVFLGAAAYTGRGSPSVGAAPAGTPHPSVTPSPSPRPVALVDATLTACAGRPATVECLEPATYRLTGDVWPRQITLSVPSGWMEWRVAGDFDGVRVDGGADAEGGSDWGVMFIAVGAVAKDPCRPAAGSFERAQTATVDGLIAAMRSWPGFSVSDAAPVTVDGIDGSEVELTTSIDAASCPDARLWWTPLGARVDAYPILSYPSADRTRVQFRIVDVDGMLLAIRTTDFSQPSPWETAQGAAPDPTRHRADQVELRSILDSIRLTALSRP